MDGPSYPTVRDEVGVNDGIGMRNEMDMRRVRNGHRQSRKG